MFSSVSERQRPLWYRLASNLTFWVLIALIAGIVVGVQYPKLAVQSKVFGDTFIAIIKWFIGPLIFFTITIGISSMNDLKKVGWLGFKAVLYFEIITTVALVIGIAIALVLQPGAGVQPKESDSAVASIERSHDFSWMSVLKENPTLQVLIVSIAIGIIISMLPRKDDIIRWLTVGLHVVFYLLRWVMVLAPIGAFGGIAYSIGSYGIEVIKALALLMVCVYCTMAIFIFVVLRLVLQVYRVSLWKFLKYIREELLIVLGTSSSESGLPGLMAKLERMGCTKPVVGLVVPAGYSFNLDGTSIYLSMATLFLTQVYQVTLSWSEIFYVVGVLMLTSKGAAGVTGSGFVVLASTMGALNVIPLEGIAILMGVDRFMSEARSITNIIGNGVACVFLANHEKEFDRQKMEMAFGPAAASDA